MGERSEVGQRVFLEMYGMVSMLNNTVLYI